MKVELTIDRTKEFPKGAFPALEKELLKRLQSQFDVCSRVMRRVSSDKLSDSDGEREVKKKVEKILQ
ncbi:DinI-like family protein [Enterobacter soli]|uniref:DinI-like family protein n=1 Tax=Enterobacter soli TaxID=885040 RepID=UPI003EDA1054